MMIVRHKVRDYGQWRPIFDQHAEMQRAAGLINPRVYHSADSSFSPSADHAAQAEGRRGSSSGGVRGRPMRKGLRAKRNPTIALRV